MFDSVSSSTRWVRMVQDATIPRVLLDSAGLVSLVGVVLLLLNVAARESRTYVMNPWRMKKRMKYSGSERADELALSVIPIVVGYVVAHYTSMFVLEGQRVAITMSDPLVRGDNLFGTAELGVNAAIFDHPTAIAWLQVAGIVVGHVVGVVAAHDLMIRWLPRRIAGQLPMLLVMVALTCAGLVLLFAR